ncbi:MAG: YncE family protein [Actinomycetia bacterium]|nr:YncE family protein [Actinomycetes bacterium]MCH9702559.1 YncE family protein [Actinomycetes bacterium]MCH9759041.1 YncE family protein [Actinomycetes bacterium]
MGRGPIGDIAAGGPTDSIVVANVADQSVSLIDSTAQSECHNVAVAGDPVALAVTDGLAYVATGSASHDAVSAIDLETRSVVATYPVAFGVTALAASPDGKRIYVGRTARDGVGVTVIDTVAQRDSAIDIGYGPAASLDALCVDPSGKRLYASVTDESGSRLVILDSETARVQRVVVIGSPIRDIAHTDGTVYVLTSDRAVGGAVHVIDLSTNRITDTAIVGGAPTQLVVSPDRARAYIVDYDRVAVLCTLSLEIDDSLAFDARPSCVVLDSDGSHLHVADYSGAVHGFSVESAIEMLCSQFLATDPIALSARRALEGSTAGR